MGRWLEACVLTIDVSVDNVSVTTLSIVYYISNNTSHDTLNDTPNDTSIDTPNDTSNDVKRQTLCRVVIHPSLPAQVSTFPSPNLLTWPPTHVITLLATSRCICVYMVHECLWNVCVWCMYTFSTRLRHVNPEFTDFFATKLTNIKD